MTEKPPYRAGCRYIEEMVGASFSPSGDTMWRPKCACGWTTDLQFFGSWAYDEWKKHARPIAVSAPARLPLHRTEAGYPRCSTCDGGGCPDCTDPA